MKRELASWGKSEFKQVDGIFHWEETWVIRMSRLLMAWWGIAVIF